MATSIMRSFFWGPYSRVCAWAVMLILVCDQAHKWWMLHVYLIAERGRIPVTPFMDFVFVLNRGISYGLFYGTGRWLLTVFAFATAIALWIWTARGSTGWLMGASLGLIIGGAIGNAIDRAIYGGVVDYVSLHAFGYYWYVFNIADMAIVAGVVGLLYDSFLTSRKSASTAP